MSARAHDADGGPAIEPAQVHLHVDRLLLRGMSAEQGQALIEQLSSSLRRRWSDASTVRELGRAGNRSRPWARDASVPADGEAGLGEAFAAALAREISR